MTSHSEPTLKVPRAEAATPIGGLGLSTRPANVLRAHNCRTLADLDGMSGSDLLMMRNMGRKSVGEILDALSRLTTVKGVREIAKLFPAAPPTKARVDRSAGTIDLSGLSFPGASAHWGPAAASDLWRSRGLFNHLRVYTVGRLLAEVATGDVFVGTAAHRTAARHLRSVSDQLRTAIKGGAYRSVDGRLWLPRRPLVKAPAAVAKARTVSEEIDAVFVWVAEQNRAAVRQRWSCTAGRFPPLEDVGQARGITRERVRQIVARAENDLRESRLWLPRTARLVAAFARQRELWTVAQMQRAFAEHGETVSEEEVRLLPTLARLGAIPDCTCDENDLFHLAGPAGISKKSRKDAKALEAKVEKAMWQLRRNGWLDGSAGWDSDSPLAVLLGRRLPATHKSFAVLDNAVLPEPSFPSSLTRWVTRRLYVARAMSVDALFDRMTTFTNSGYGKRLKLRLPSRPAFAAMLARDPRFVVERGRVKLHAKAARHDPLTASERKLIDRLRAVGGSMEYADFVAFAEKKGMSISVVALLAQGPLLDRVRKGRYRLPGARA